MVKVNLYAFDELSVEEVENRLSIYKNSGYAWRTTNKNDFRRYHLKSPNYIFEPIEVLDYFEDIKLEAGNLEQIEHFKTLNLLALISSKNNCYLDSDQIN